MTHKSRADDTEFMESVFINPESYQDPWVNRRLTDIVPNLIAYNVIAYNDRNVEQSLTLGATSNVTIEARSNVNMFISPTGEFKLFETSVYPSTSIRTDTEMLSVKRDPSSGATVISSPNPVAVHSDSDHVTISKTTFNISSNQQSLRTSAPWGFLMDNNIQVNGNAFINDHLVAVGNIYGNNLNMFRTYPDPNHDRVGFAFTINDEEQLELIKYSRYFNEETREYNIVTRKIVTFGGRPFLMTDPSDVAYNGFDLLDGANVDTNNIQPNNVTFSGVGNGTPRPVIDTASRGFNMTLDGDTKFSGDIVPTFPSMFDIGQSAYPIRNIHATSLNITGDSYYKGQLLVSSQWAANSSNIYFGTDTPDGVGNVGIGTVTPSYRLTVNGEIASSGDHIAYSDQRLKSQIEKIPNALEKVKQLSGYTFVKNSEHTNKRHAGVLAQEVKDVLPEVVHEDERGFMSVAYGNMVGLLIEAIKELSDRLPPPRAKRATSKTIM